MGNCFSNCYNSDSIIERTCPYCNFIFNSKNKKNKHMKNCLYNKGNNSFTHKSIYDNVYNGL